MGQHRSCAWPRGGTAHAYHRAGGVSRAGRVTELKQQPGSSKRRVMPLKEAYLEEMEAQLTTWSAKLDAMKAVLEESELQDRMEFHRQVEASQRHHEVARRHLDELKQAGEEAWETLKSGIEGTWKELA